MTSTLREAADRFVRPEGTYLLSHAIGLPLRSARESLAADYFEAWEDNPADCWTTWLANVDGFRSSLAALLASDTASICPQPNVSSGLTKILGALPHTGQTPTILLSEDAFPSLGYVCTSSGWNVRYIERSAQTVDLGVWADHMSHDVDAVLVTHAHSNNGAVSPVASICEIAKQRSIITIVDAAQSVGVLPIDVNTWDADFVVGSCVKWLCGGPGAGWLWANPKIIDRCTPRDVGWFSHSEPFEFDIHNFRYAQDALRFWGGTPSVLGFTIARRSIDEIAAAGIEEIRAHNLALTGRLIEGAGGLTVSPTAPQDRSGTTIIHPGKTIDLVIQRLSAAGVNIDRRPNGLRISPHLYNTADDIDLLLSLLTD